MEKVRGKVLQIFCRNLGKISLLIVALISSANSSSLILELANIKLLNIARCFHQSVGGILSCIVGRTRWLSSRPTLTS